MSSSPPSGTSSPDLPNDGTHSESTAKDVEDLEAAARESADGTSIDVDGISVDVNARHSFEVGQKEKDDESHELDKDIDAVLEYNVKNEQVDPNGSANIYDITTDTTLRSDMRESETQSMDESLKERIGLTDKGALTSSEKSFTSDTDSSALAESVVKKVMAKAVDIVKFEQTTGLDEPNQVQSDKAHGYGDVKVGLFQYQDLEASDNDDQGEESEGDNDVRSDGQFQTEEDIKTPEASDADDLVEDKVESLNEEEKENILKLYGLEGVESISPKSASPIEDDTEPVQMFDVQRDVYVPSTKRFSVTRDTSSSESTPRLASNEADTGKKSDTEDGNIDRVSLESGSYKGEGNNDDIFENEFNEQRKKSDASQEQNFEEKHFEQQLTTSISPPLVQYEPVKENGKFRIVKTAKQGGGTEYSAIRVGGELTPQESPRSDHSPKESPREFRTGDTVNKISDDIEEVGGHPAPQNTQKLTDEDELTPVRLEDNVTRKSLPDTGVKDSAFAEKRDDSIEMDREKIRKLIQKESKPMVPRDLESSYDSGASRSKYSTRAANLEKLSPRQLSLSELHDPNSSRIRYTTRDTRGREVKRTGPEPYEMGEGDMLASDSRYLEVQAQERPMYDRNKSSYDSSRTETTGETSRVSTSYEEDLLRSAYSRVTDHSAESSHSAPVRSHESTAIPGFKTLQDQQAKWSDMFHKLEDEHRRELHSQYERHQYNIQRLQQQMELELQKQHLAIRKKLDIHKEALTKMSPDRDQSRRYRSPDRSQSPEVLREGGQRSAERSRTERSIAEKSENLATLDRRTWREIYHEVREEEERTLSPSRPLKRSLDSEFDTMDTTVERSKHSGRRSPRGSSDLSRSGSRERSRDQDAERSPRSGRPSKADRDRSLSKEGQRSYEQQRSPDGHVSRSQNKGAPREDVSRHVRELLDSLNDSRHSLHDLEEGMTSVRSSGYHGDKSSERPRAGVYSSPMPLLSRSRFSKSTGAEYSKDYDSSRLTQSLPLNRDRAEFYSERSTAGGRDRSNGSPRTDESTLSPSSRMNLREKHSKHLADLRAYYEDELRELRKALADTLDASAVSADTSVQSTVQNQLLEAENKHLVEKCSALEEQIDELHLKIRNLEQKNHGLEKRASEYAAAFADSQAMSIQHRAHIEELQRYCRERDDLINDLESKKLANEDSVKLYKKNLEDEMELHRQDKIQLQRMHDRYESLEREYKLLQETMNTTENKLYEARTEVVELNRTIAKLELENKRLGRENDNLRHKVTQSLNLSTLHESFGSPSSPREIQHLLQSRSPGSTEQATTASSPTKSAMDTRVPGFATSMQDWSPARQKLALKSAGNQSRSEDMERSRQSGVARQKKESKSRRKDGESSKGRQPGDSLVTRQQGEGSSLSSSREDVANRSQKTTTASEDERPTRDTSKPGRERSPAGRETTPPRPISPSSQSESDVGDYSPLLKAERELFKLRDMMRQAVAVRPSFSPPQPKLQKKFYGSDRPSSKDSYNPDLGVPRGRKEKPSISSHSSVAKTKGSQTSGSKSDRGSDKSGAKRPSSDKVDKVGPKSREQEKVTKEGSSDKKKDVKECASERKKEKQRERSPQRMQDANTSTRFDIDFNEEDRTVSVTPRKTRNQGKEKDLCNGNAGSQSQEVNGIAAGSNSKEAAKGADGDKVERKADQGEVRVENTLDMMRHGQFMAWPEWEDVYTSMAKPKSEPQEKTKSMEERVRERLQTISELESRYDGLQAEKRQLESSLNKIPLHGRVDRNSRLKKEELEEKLDRVERELGSLRMTLKRYNVLKTAG